jgi:hypothetical protein
MDTTKQDKIIFKINVALKTNYWKKQICRIIFRNNNELIHISCGIEAIENNYLVLEDNSRLELVNIVDVNF